MIIDPKQLEELQYLAEQLESGDYFEQNTREFIRRADVLKARIYRHCEEPDILDLLDRLPEIELQPYRRSFLEQMLPKAGRNMVGKYKVRETIREQARQTLTIFKQIRRWLGE